MRCPNCGSQATIRGNRWECGWCGDSGRLSRPEEQQPQVISLSFSGVVWRVDLSESWRSMKMAVLSLPGEGPAPLLRHLGKVALHEITLGMKRGSVESLDRKWSELDGFLDKTPDLNVAVTAEEIKEIVNQGKVLFPAEGAISERKCGTFWTDLMELLPQEYYYEHGQDTLDTLFSELGDICVYFTEEDSWQDPERKDEIQDAFYTHWQRKILFRPDAERAKYLLSCGAVPGQEDICRDILVAEFPEEIEAYTAEELDELFWDDILKMVMERDVTKALIMWCRLLEIASPCLSNSDATARNLLVDWFDPADQDPVEAKNIFSALSEETTERAIFQSAFVGRLQYKLLQGSRTAGRDDLCLHWLGLLEKNSYPQSKWSMHLEQMQRAAGVGAEHKVFPKVRTAHETDAVEDGTVYRYCQVLFPDMKRPYAYLTEDPTIGVGDEVYAPLGARDTAMKGRVVAVGDCLRSTAPCPPERTKKVLYKA